MSAEPYAQARSFPGIVVANAAALRAVASNLFIDGGQARIFVAGSPPPDDYLWDSTSSASDDGTNVIKPSDVSGNGRWLLNTGGGGGITPPAGDIGGSTGFPIIESLQGIPTADPFTANANSIVSINYIPPWTEPNDVSFDGTDLWIGDGGVSPGESVACLFRYDLSSTVTKYLMPTGVTAILRVIAAASTPYVLLAVQGAGGQDLLIFDSGTNAIVGIGVFSIGSAVDFDLGLGSGQVYTVDPTSGVNLFDAGAMLAGYPTPQAPVATLALPNGFALADDASSLLFASDSTSHHVKKIDSGSFTVTGTYTDGSARTMGSLFYAFGSVWCSVTGTNHLLRINPTTMALQHDITGGSHAGTTYGRIGSDGTYIYVCDEGTNYVQVFDPGTNLWVNEYVTNAILGGTSVTGIASLSGSVWVTVGEGVGPASIGLQEYVVSPTNSFIGAPGQVYADLPPLRYINWSPVSSGLPNEWNGWLAYSSATSYNELFFRYSFTNHIPLYLVDDPGVGRFAGFPWGIAIGGATPPLSTVQLALDEGGAAVMIAVQNGSTLAGEFLYFDSTLGYFINEDHFKPVTVKGSVNGVYVALASSIALVNGSLIVTASNAGLSITSGYFDILTRMGTPAAPASGYRLFIDGSGNLMAENPSAALTQLAPSSVAYFDASQYCATHCTENTGGNFTVGILFYNDGTKSCVMTGARYRIKNTGGALTYTAKLWSYTNTTTGTLVDSQTISVTASSGEVVYSVTWTSPVTLVPGQIYAVTVHDNGGTTWTIASYVAGTFEGPNSRSTNLLPGQHVYIAPGTVLLDIWYLNADGIPTTGQGVGFMYPTTITYQ
jgi:hypothetical protein